MKTLLIQLEPHDDLVSIRDRLDWAKTPRVLLVWPKKGRVGLRPLDLALLRRHAIGLGAQLGLVTRQGEMRAAAHELGIPCFRKTSEAQQKPWPEALPLGPQRRFPRLDLRAVRQALLPPDPFDVRSDPLSRVGVFALGVLALLAILLVLIPSAKIRLTPPTQTQSMVISVSAAPDVKAVQLSGAVPMRQLSQTFESSATALATGQLSQPDQKAEGVARFTNLTSQAISIPAQTVLLTRSNPPVAFVTVEAAEVPAGKKKALDLPIRAVEGGTRGNLPAGALSGFEGPLGISLQVTNPLPLTGGTDQLVATPTEQDLQFLRSRLGNDLEREARATFAAQIPAGDVLLPSTFKQAQVVTETSFPAPGQSGEKLSLTLKVEYSIAYVQAADLEKLAALALDAALPAGSAPAPGTLTYAPAAGLVETQGIIYWQIRAERQVRAQIEAGQVIPLVTGKTARRAGSLLVETFGLAESPQISINPLWWPWLPFLPLQITVEG